MDIPLESSFDCAVNDCCSLLHAAEARRRLMDCENQTRRLFRMRTDVGGFHVDCGECWIHDTDQEQISDYTRCLSHGLTRTTLGTPQR